MYHADCTLFGMPSPAVGTAQGTPACAAPPCPTFPRPGQAQGLGRNACRMHATCRRVTPGRLTMVLVTHVELRLEETAQRRRPTRMRANGMRERARAALQSNALRA